MVNDKMVNGFMKKKQYITPLSEYAPIDMQLLAKTGEASLPPGPGGAPIFMP